MYRSPVLRGTVRYGSTSCMSEKEAMSVLNMTLGQNVNIPHTRVAKIDLTSWELGSQPQMLGGCFPILM